MTWNNTVCKICETVGVSSRRIPTKADTCEIECPKCGYYQITDTTLEMTHDISKDEMLLFSGYLCQHSSREEPILLKSDDFLKIPEIVFPYLRMSVLDKIENLIRYIYSSAKNITGPVRISINEMYSFYILSREDFQLVINYLNERQLARCGFDARSETIHFNLTIPGWEAYEEIKNRVLNVHSKQAFVAMSFDDGLKNIFTEGIEPAVKACGFEAVRIDMRQDNEKICEQIIAEINKSRFLIADFTQNKHGVYFEAGYALGIGIPVIWMCHKDQIDSKDLHFDTQQYRHIPWVSAADLKTQLVHRIQATIR